MVDKWNGHIGYCSRNLSLLSLVNYKHGISCE